MIGQASFHCGRHAQRLMNPAKIVIHENRAPARARGSQPFFKSPAGEIQNSN
jgi:hypothetical protein